MPTVPLENPISTADLEADSSLDPSRADLTGSFLVGQVEIQGRVALAPMAGVSVQAFRRQGRRHGAGLVCSEMVSACGLNYGNERTAGYLQIASDEHPIAVQLFGSDPALMAEAAAMVKAAGADLIDINMGCPVKKVTRTAAGCKLLDDHDTAVAVAKAVVEATDLPVMTKIRRGMRNGSRDCLTLGPRLVEEAGVAALTLHPRSAAQMYTGHADHSLTRELVELVDVPIFASGDITNRARAQAVLAYTGAASVMIGRAAQGNPWLLQEMAFGEPVDPTPEDRVAELVRFMREVAREMTETRATGFLRKFYGWYLRGPAFGRMVRNELMLMESPTKVEAALLERFPGALPMVEELERTVRYPSDEDSVLELPISIYGGG
jgi:tRNA-dihydrouridine synthase B